VAQIEIIDEQEITAGWQFQAQILDDQGQLHLIQLTLAWADYNLWSPAGVDEPACVAEAVVRFMLSRSDASEIKTSLDASLVRRLHHDADAIIPSLIYSSD